MDDQPHPPLTLPRERGRDHGDVPPQPQVGSPSKPGAPPESPSTTPPPKPRSRLRSALTLLLVLAIIGGLIAWVVMRVSPKPAQTGRFQTTGPMPVGTAKISKGDMPIVLTALGTVTPLATVTVKTQINGQLIDVAFKEGQMVKKDDLLAQIDPRPYQVALEQAEGQLAKDQAALKNSEVDLARYKTLVAQNSIARQTLDTQVALVEQNRGTVKADQALVDTQKLNLVYCRVTSPVNGRVGLRQVDAGNYVQTSDPNGLVVITQLQPISVIFTLPEDNLPAVLRQMHAGAKLEATAYDRTGVTKLGTGILDTMDNQIDTTTGTVKLRAVFDNPEQILFPNQFVNIRLLVNTMRDATLAPTAAIQRGAPGTFVYVVKPDETVSAQPVTTGATDSKNVMISKGLQVGDMVVTDGADRLKDGAKVKPETNPPAGGKAQPAADGGGSGAPDASGTQPAGQSPDQAQNPDQAKSPDQGQDQQGQGRQRGQGRRRGNE